MVMIRSREKSDIYPNGRPHIMRPHRDNDIYGVGEQLSPPLHAHKTPPWYHRKHCTANVYYVIVQVAFTKSGEKRVLEIFDKTSKPPLRPDSVMVFLRR